MSSNGHCKVCGSAFFLEPLLRYPDMPGVAQHLPTPDSVEQDRGMDLDVFQCSGCGLVQLDVEPVPYFRETIRAVGVSAAMQGFRLRQFREFITANDLSGRKFLEIGCGEGDYLRLLREAGADAHGLEWGGPSVQACRAHGLPVTRGFVESEGYSVPHAPYDGFAIFSFLEHLPEPVAVLRGIHHNLNAGATGLVEVPNFDMIVRGHMFSEFMRDHLFYFNRETLANTLARSGFEVVEITEIWQQYILSAVVRKRRPMDLSAFAIHQAKLQDEIDRFVRESGRVAIWGAGHQAFAIMALAKLRGRICYVVDSAAFKQGKLTPLSHLPIVAPAMLQKDPVNGLLIMAGSYGDEIAGIVKRMPNAPRKVAILRDFGLEVAT